jgi:hypothetical protein
LCNKFSSNQLCYYNIAWVLSGIRE